MTSDKAIIVTAAGRGMGEAISRRLAADGAKLALLSPSDHVVTLAEELGALAVQGSITEPGDLDALVSQTVERYGRIDGVVSNAGHAPKGPLLELTDEDWRAGLDMNFLSVVRLARLVTPHFVKNRGGSIVAISSFCAYEPEADFPMTVLRAGLGAWMKIYADNVAKDNIRMNCVLPGFVNSLPEKEERRERIPMGRYGTVEEISNVVAFLLSDAASYVTGQNIKVDGGLTRSIP